MNLLLKQKITLVVIIIIFVITACAMLISAIVFRQEISNLYLVDYSERIKNIEFDYSGVDAVSAASEDVSTVQQGVLTNLEDKYLSREGLTSYPFILNGDGEIILNVEHSKIKVTDSLVSRIVQGSSGSFDIQTPEGPCWVIFSHFEAWDWYTGYIIPDSVRFSAFTRFIFIFGLASFVSIILAFFGINFFISRQFLPMKELTAHALRAGEGDFSSLITIRNKDEIGNLAETFNIFTHNLRQLIGHIQSAVRNNTAAEKSLIESVETSLKNIHEGIESTEELTRLMDVFNKEIGQSQSSTSTILEDIQLLNSQIQEHSKAVTRATEAMKTMVTTIASASTITNTVIHDANALLSTAREGSTEMNLTISAIAEITKSIEEISGFVNIIQGISQQTNLLSMNAAIEAAHAGDSGRGFAVVAEEIRALASKSSGNAKKISDTVKGIIGRIQAASAAGSKTSGVFTEILDKTVTMNQSLQDVVSHTGNLESASHTITEDVRILSSATELIQDRSDHTARESTRIGDSLSVLTRTGMNITGQLQKISAGNSSTSESVTRIEKAAAGMSDDLRNLETNVAKFKI